MARPLRLEFEDAIYHLLGRGNARQRIFASERDQLEFVKLVEASSKRFDVAVLAFVLMGNHFHLLAQTHRANLSRWMHWLMVSYTVYFNWRHGRSGHLFQGRYKSFLVEDGEYLLGLSRYMHLNPVRNVQKRTSSSTSTIGLTVMVLICAMEFPMGTSLWEGRVMALFLSNLSVMHIKQENNVEKISKNNALMQSAKRRSIGR